jgi:hypothetical protein
MVQAILRNTSTAHASLHGVRASAPRPPRSAVQPLALFLLLALWLVAFLAPSARAEEAKALGLGKPPVKITILLGPRNDFCYSDHIEAIEKLVSSEKDRINKSGGIAGRPLEVSFRDDQGDARRTVDHVGEALADPQSIAMIGLQSSDRAREVFKQHGPSLIGSGIPWLSSLASTSLFASYPNVFTMRGSQEEESIPVIAEFVKDRKFSRPAFLGLKGQPFIEATVKGLEATKGFPSFVAKHFFETPGADSKARLNAPLDQAEIAQAADSLKQANPDIVFLFVGSWRTPAFLKELEKAGVSAPLFVTGRLDDIFRSGDSYSGDVYQIARDELPNLYNNRVRARLFRERPEAWAFSGARNADAFARKENGCQERQANKGLDILSRSNLRAIGIGLEFRDMVAMIADILKTKASAKGEDDIAVLRQAIYKEIPARFASGKGIYRGSLEDWSFRPFSRSTVRTPFIVSRPAELKRQQLAPIQYVPLKDGNFRKIPTLYLEVDLIKVYRIDDMEKSFTADFYLSMSSENAPSIDMIEFSNAFLDYKTNSRQVIIRPLHENEPSDTYPNDMKVYLVSGKFMLDPNYKSYPFDTQRFTIELSPKHGEQPFIVQPLDKELRRNTFDADGWDTRDAYVSYDQDSVSIVDTRKLEPSVIPFYKSSFVWVLKRSATDFFLRVVVPLFFIAIVAYLAIFIAHHHFEAIVTIQVTALLSAVALYITTPKVDSDTATISDRIFLFNYMMFSLMIGISILRVNKFVGSTMHMKRALAVLHLAVIPVCLALMTLYVFGVSGSETHAELDFWPAVADGVGRFLGHAN